MQATLNKDHKIVKQGIWLYFLLLICEGALRKWVLPGLATPLLIIRDPVALFLLYLSWKKGLLQFNVYLVLMMFIGIFSIFAAVLSGHGSLPVALYGARIFLFHFPMIFIIGRVFTQEDVIRLGKVVLMIAIPMTVLIALQFYSPQSAWVNRGVGGDAEGGGFSGALGYFRPPGTFSFTTGNSQFYSLVACFLFYFWLNPAGKMRLLLIAATAALLIAIPLSISRSLFFQVAISFLFVFVAILHKPKYLGHLLLSVISVSLVLAILSKTEIFLTASEAFTARFENASESEGGLEGTLVDRFLGGMLSAISKSGDQPFFGYGIGLGTNVGSMLIAGGRQFLIAEEEWGRIIGELGTLLGLGVILIRISLVTNILFVGYQYMRVGNLLPWMLTSFGLLMLTQGQWAQPTTLGFSSLIGGLMVASFNSKADDN